MPGPKRLTIGTATTSALDAVTRTVDVRRAGAVPVACPHCREMHTAQPDPETLRAHCPVCRAQFYVLSAQLITVAARIAEGGAH